MCRTKVYLFSFFTLITITSCEKAVDSVPISSVTVVNAVIGTYPIFTDFSGTTPISQYFLTSSKINYGSFFEFSRPSGLSHFVAYQITDTTNAIYTTQGKSGLDLQPQGIYSLFLCGAITSGMQPDALWVEDTLPSHLKPDSTFGLRFINLSPDNTGINITLSSSPTTNEVTNLGYKSITGYKSYPAIASISRYTFQVRDPSTNQVLVSFNMNGINNGAGTNRTANAYRYRNFTLVFRGFSNVASGQTARGAFLVNNY